MVWPFKTKTKPQTPERKSGSFYFGSPLIAPATASYTRLADEGYGQNAVAFACANRIATAVGSVELQLFKKRNGGSAERVESNPLLDLLDRPNPMQSGREFMGHLTSYLALSGNSYILAPTLENRGNRPPKELVLLSPEYVTVEKGTAIGIPKEYIYKPDANQRFVYPVDAFTGRSAVLHLKTFNPRSPWYGMAPMTAAALAIDMHNAGGVWNYSLLKSGARPSGALVVKNKDGSQAVLTEEEFHRLKNQFDEDFTGSGNAGKPLLLEGGLEWQEMSINPKDMEFLEGKNSAARDIALAFGVPPQLLGIPGDNTYANYEQATLAFWTETVIPLMQLIIGGLNRWLTPLYGEGLYLWYDPEMIDALEPLRQQKFNRLNGAGFLSVNEKREATGFDDTEGGETVLVSTTSIPLSLAGTDVSTMLNDPNGQGNVDPATTA